MYNEDEKNPAPISNLNSNLKSSNTNNTNNNTFLDRNHYPEKSTHPPISRCNNETRIQSISLKVSMQRNQSKSNKILDLIESDSEINNDDIEEKDNDEDYDINESGNY